jgi:hypothetical protein
MGSGNKAGDRFQKETSIHYGNVVCKDMETASANRFPFFTKLAFPQKTLG